MASIMTRSIATMTDQTHAMTTGQIRDMTMPLSLGTTNVQIPDTMTGTTMTEVRKTMILLKPAT